MLIKVFSLPFNSIHGGFNDDSVREFLKDKELISARDYLFTKNDVPYLVFILQYFPYRSEINAKPSEKKEKDEAWRKLLTEADLGFFNILRDWRSQQSKKEGMPPYILFTNWQLAMIVKSRPQSLAELTKIEGIGNSKASKYGAEILSMTKIDLGVKKEESDGS